MDAREFQKLLDAATDLAGGQHGGDMPVAAIEAFINACKGYVEFIKGGQPGETQIPILWMDGVRNVSTRGKGMSINLPKSFCDQHGLKPGITKVEFGEIVGDARSKSGPMLVMLIHKPDGA